MEYVTNKKTINEEKYLKKVYLGADVYATCIQHALSTEKEEVMGLLIGHVDEEEFISYISACMILHRSDKQPDRVEISPEQLYTASGLAEELGRKLNKPMRVLGWYHSHPHITVWPSHVDVRTQSMYQTMDRLFVGLIFSVYQNDTGSVGNIIQMTCFQTCVQNETELQRREIPIVINNAPIHHYSIEGLTNLPRILAQEEMECHTEDTNDLNEELTNLHNDAFKTIALVHIVSKIALPLCDALEARLKATNLRIKELEKIKDNLMKN